MTDVEPPMHDAPSPQQAAHRRRWPWIVLVVVVAVVGTFAGAVVWSFRAENRPIPSFASLAQTPDPTLSGTVAYFDAQGRCVRIVAAAGQPSKSVYCLPAEGPQQWVTVGKPAGPQLVWRPDGRLEITMFRMKPDPNAKTARPLTAGWQRIVDVRTGAVEDVPAAQVPSTPVGWPDTTTSPSGQKVAYTFNAMNGSATVTLTDTSGTRTLLSVQGPGKYGYQFGPVFFAPNWKWIAATDTANGRILVITPADPSVTRVLVESPGFGAGGGTAGPTFAVSSTNYLTSAK